jgi:sec-independent protein translocase protein TatB
MLGGLSMTEIIIILGLALLLLGPDQLPSLAKSLGKGLRELRKATDDIKGQFESEMARIDLDAPQQKSIAPVPPPPPDVTAAGTSTPETKPAEAPPTNPADDPAAARAAARRAAAESQLKLVAPEGTVPRKTEEPAAAASEPKA